MYPIIVVLFVVALAAMAFYFLVIDASRRRGRVNAEAAALGMRFEPRLSPAEGAARGFLRPSMMDDLCNVASGQRGPTTFARFDFVRAKYGSNWLVVLTPDLQLPPFRVFPRDSADAWGLAHDIQMQMRYQLGDRQLPDIPLDDRAAFAALYRVQGDPPAAVAALFRAGFADVLAKTTGITLEVEPGRFWIRDRSPTHDLRQDVERGVAVADALRSRIGQLGGLALSAE